MTAAASRTLLPRPNPACPGPGRRPKTRDRILRPADFRGLNRTDPALWGGSPRSPPGAHLPERDSVLPHREAARSARAPGGQPHASPGPGAMRAGTRKRGKGGSRLRPEGSSRASFAPLASGRRDESPDQIFQDPGCRLTLILLPHWTVRCAHATRFGSSSLVFELEMFSLMESVAIYEPVIALGRSAHSARPVPSERGRSATTSMCRHGILEIPFRG